MTRGFLASLSTPMALSTADGSARHLGGAGHLRIFLDIEPFLIIISLPTAAPHANLTTGFANCLICLWDRLDEDDVDDNVNNSNINNNNINNKGQ